MQLVDVFPTAAEIAGVDLASFRGEDDRPLELDGFSLLPLLRDPAAPSRHDVIDQDRFRPNGPGPYARGQRMVRDTRYKRIENIRTGELEFYDLQDRLIEGPGLVAAMQPEERAAADRLHKRLDKLGVAMDADRQHHLPGPR